MTFHITIKDEETGQEVEGWIRGDFTIKREGGEATTITLPWGESRTIYGDRRHLLTVEGEFVGAYRMTEPSTAV